MKNFIKNLFVICSTGVGAIVGFVTSGLISGSITVKSDSQATIEKENEDKAE